MAKQRRTNKPPNKNKTTLTHKFYYWITAIVLTIALLFFFRTSLMMYYYIIKEKFEEREYGYPDLEKMRKEAEAKKIQLVFQKYRENAFGLDISQYQGNINWDSLQTIKTNLPISFVFMRASIGSFNQDSFFKKNWKNCKKKNIIRGAYHYYDVNKNSTDQANNFINTVKLEKGDLPPVLDVEELPKNQSLNSLKQELLNWLQIVEKNYKVKPIIYSNDAYFIYHISDLDLSAYPIWVANYNPRGKPIHKKWIFWQFTEKGIIKGITQNFTDINVFNGNIDNLKKLTLKQ